MTRRISRRDWMRLAGAAGFSAMLPGAPAATPPLFDGRTLGGWTQIENNATSLSAGSIVDPAAFVKRLTNGPDALSVNLHQGMPEALRADLAVYSPDAPNAKAVVSALVKYLNQVIAGPPLDPAARGENPPGYRLARLNKVALENAYPADLQKSATTGWTVKDGAMASTGVGRGVIYTAGDYGRFRLTFTMRHVSGNPDHQACVLIFCQRPRGDEKPLDALGGIQFQVPNGGHWDYRPGMNNAGGAEFTSINKVRFDPHEWSRVEILADASKGTARMAVAQPPASKAVEVLAFRDPAAGRTGPIAWQMHNAGLFDEYKDVAIDPDPEIDDLITVRG
jgi:hypothetical protein